MLTVATPRVVPVLLSCLPACLLPCLPACLPVQSISGAFDPDQSRTEDAMADEALTNKEESREALAFIGRLVVIPLITGALISRAITDPVLSFSLQVGGAMDVAGGCADRQSISRDVCNSWRHCVVPVGQTPACFWVEKGCMITL